MPTRPGYVYFNGMSGASQAFFTNYCDRDQTLWMLLAPARPISTDGTVYFDLASGCQASASWKRRMFSGSTIDSAQFCTCISCCELAIANSNVDIEHDSSTDSDDDAAAGDYLRSRRYALPRVSGINLCKLSERALRGVIGRPLDVQGEESMHALRLLAHRTMMRNAHARTAELYINYFPGR